ncbi:MAG: glycerol kinase GlpK [Clostridia bacterium]|nr:glycerol kinase GlpK [Clostridia bacterium]MBR2973133.1 glycerol kinase GlpK [Clostridia bacterium]
MQKKYFLGLDQGTTGTTALLFDEKWNQVSVGYQEITQFYPNPGLVEHNGEELVESLLKATEQALKNINANANEIKCIGLDNQGETIILWDKKTGKPVYPAIVWQDRRTAAEVDELNKTHAELFYSRTGLKLDSFFGATKIRWVLKNIPETKELLKQHRLAAGTLDTWFIWKLTGGKEFVTDCVTAGRTCLMNVDKLCWDKEILDLLEIPIEILPEIRENATLFGTTEPDDFLGAAIPITGSIVDQQAALLGQGCNKYGDIKTTYGTGSFMLMNTGETRQKSDAGLLSTLALVHNGKPSYALDGGIYIAGAAVNWLKNGLKIIETAQQADELARSVKDNGGVYFVTAFSGLAAPYWDSYARGTMVGITGGCTKAHIARATLEATAYQVKDIFDIISSDSKTSIQSMRADGGSTASKFLMQFQADLLGIPVEIPVISETTGLGAAFLAALGIGEISSLEEMSKLWKRKAVYEPRMSEDERMFLIDRWHRAVERAKRWAIDE